MVFVYGHILFVIRCICQFCFVFQICSVSLANFEKGKLRYNKRNADHRVGADRNLSYICRTNLFSCITLFVLFVGMCLGSFTLCRSSFSLKCRRGSKCLGLLGTYDRGGNVSYSLQQTSDRRPQKNKYHRKLTFLMPKQGRFARTAEFILYYGYDTVYCVK